MSQSLRRSFDIDKFSWPWNCNENSLMNAIRLLNFASAKCKLEYLVISLGSPENCENIHRFQTHKLFPSYHLSWKIAWNDLCKFIIGHLVIGTCHNLWLNNLTFWLEQKCIYLVLGCSFSCVVSSLLLGSVSVCVCVFRRVLCLCFVASKPTFDK